MGGGSVGGKNAEHGGKKIDGLLRLPLRVANSRHSRQVAQMAGKVPGVRAKLPVSMSEDDQKWREKLHQGLDVGVVARAASFHDHVQLFLLPVTFPANSHFVTGMCGENGGPREELTEDAACGPDIRGSGVMCLAEKKLRRTIPKCHDIVCVANGIAVFELASQTEVRQFDHMGVTH